MDPHTAQNSLLGAAVTSEKLQSRSGASADLSSISGDVKTQYHLG